MGQIHMGRANPFRALVACLAAQGSRRREALPRGGRCGLVRRGLWAGPEVPGLQRLEGRLHRRRCPEVALPLLRQEVQTPSRAPYSSAAESRSPPGSPSSGPCALTPPSSARPSCAASPTRRPSSGGTACSPRYPATRTVPCCATPSGSTRTTSTTRPLQGLWAAPQAQPIPP